MLTAQKAAGTSVKTAEQTAEQTAADAAETALSTAGTAQELVNPQASVHMDDEGVTVQVGAAGTAVTVTTG